MNTGDIVLFCIIFLGSLRRDTYIFVLYGILMLIHFNTFSSIPAENYADYYLSDALFCFFMSVFLPKNRDGLFLTIILLICIVVDLFGLFLWCQYFGASMYDNLYLGIYIVILLYILPRVCHVRVYKLLESSNSILRSYSYFMYKYMGSDK